MTIQQTNTLETGRYAARLDYGQSFDSAMKLRDTYLPSVYWIPSNGAAETRAWQGNGYWATPSGKRSAQACANKRCGQLRVYLKQTGERWEIVQQREAIERERFRGRKEKRAKRIREAIPALLLQHSDLIDSMIADALHGVEFNPSTLESDLKTLREAFARFIAHSTTERCDSEYNPVQGSTQ